MAAVDLICCPYDSGRRDWRCGRGPTRILEQGAVARIEAAGSEVRLVEIEPRVSYESENALGFEVQRRIAEATAKVCIEEKRETMVGAAGIEPATPAGVRKTGPSLHARPGRSMHFLDKPSQRQSLSISSDTQLN